MKQMTSFRPSNSSDTLTITTTTASSTFPAANLKDILPTKSYKTTSVGAEQTIKYDFGGLVSYNGAMLNRINFAEFYLETSPDNSAWTNVEHVTGLVKDEIHDEFYMHRYVEITTVNYRYIRIRIPAQTPLFEPTYFKIGNFLVGNFVTIWNPKSGYSVNQVTKRAIKEFPSGYVSSNKIGKTRRVFSGNFDKITMTEYLKIVQTYEPFVLYHEFDGDKTSVYLVKITKDISKDYFMANRVNHPFSFDEIV